MAKDPLTNFMRNPDKMLDSNHVRFKPLVRKELAIILAQYYLAAKTRSGIIWKSSKRKFCQE